jgi:Raf kinase inhibitor-like YbhB/YbcL family protein
MASAGMAGAAVTQPFRLVATNASMLNADEFAFPATSLPPMNQSPEFNWSGVPANAQSLALVFTDATSTAYKWVLWDIPPTVTHVPAAIPGVAMPMQVPGATQLGSLGNQGYAGPCCTDHVYEFVLWALDVAKLPDAAGHTTAELRQTVLPAHQIAMTPPVRMRIGP